MLIHVGIPYTGLVYCEKKKDTCNKYVLGFVAATGKNFENLVDVRLIAKQLCY